MSKLPPLDLTILKKLVSELEEGSIRSSEIKLTTDKPPVDYIVEMSKVAGLVSGIVTECTLLIGDVSALVKMSQQPTPAKSSNLFDSILSGIKGGPSN